MRPESSVFTELLSRPCEVTSAESVGGGCISEAWRVGVRIDADSDGDLVSHREWFVKTNEVDSLDNFQAESDGLHAMAEASVSIHRLRVPKPIVVGAAAGRSWLVLPWIRRESATGGTAIERNRFSEMGRCLAQLHRCTIGDDIGWPRDNYLGSTPQINTASTDWMDFVAEHRIGFQIRRAKDAGLADSMLVNQCERIIRSLDQILAGRDRRTSLIHGDLWSGNYFVDQDDMIVLIDPAVYRGCREAEFGMLKLFGSCPPSFYDAYQADFPMADGWQDRVNVYVLYHLLNHLNLFGASYLSQCKTTAANVLA